MRARHSARLFSPLAALAMLAGCAGIIPTSGPVSRPTPAPAPAPTPAPAATTPAEQNASLLGVRAAGRPDGWGSDPVDIAAALDSFGESCSWAGGREDRSGLTRPEDWREACEAVARWPRDNAKSFFERYFRPVRVGDGQAFATGYFEPEILGSRTSRPGFGVPVYKVPEDLIRCWRDDTPMSEREGSAPLGRYDASGECVDYFDRAEIEAGALAGRGLEIAWAADPIEFFFLQVQGSGRLATPEGAVIRIGYAGQNGHSYTGIGGLMRERGLLGDGPGQYAGSMQGIMQYIRENPVAGAALMRENRSWVFFRELEGDGPIGSIGVPVRGHSSVAVDPRYVPYGAPVWLDLDRDEADGLWIAQDTGGAIKGANRFDTFWGAGETARRIAGGMSGRGAAIILLPNAAATRLGL